MTPPQILITGYDDAMEPLGSLTAPWMLDFANRHHMDFLCARNYPKHTPAYWHKLKLVIDAFNQGFEFVMWLDADQAITNFKCAPSPDPEGMRVSLDWGADAYDSSFFSMCGFVAPKGAKFLFEWVASRWAEYMDKDFPEQEPMRWLYRNSSLARSWIRVEDRRVFNAVPPDLVGAIDPWQPGDFSMHLTHVPVEERVKKFHQIIRLPS